MRKNLGLYIHIPFCASKCHYCDFTSYPGQEMLWEAYTDAVCKELELKAPLFKEQALTSVFIGGGTPSLISPLGIVKIMTVLKQSFLVVPEAEISIESNPGTLDERKLALYRQSGINRLSIGLQSSNPALLKALGRIHTPEQFDLAVRIARQEGFSNINGDILMGIPQQSMAAFMDTVEHLGDLNLEHISCYSLKIEENTVFGRMEEEGRLESVDEELDRAMYASAMKYFGSLGFEHYEISNFAKPRHQCLHNINYWEGGNYVAAGAGAHAYTHGRRYANTPDIKAYIKSIEEGRPLLVEDEEIGPETAISEKIILGLRMRRGIDLGRLSQEYGRDLNVQYKGILSKLVSFALVEQQNSVIKLTKKGLDLANQVWMEFI